MKKYFIFGDVHGEWTILRRELEAAGFDKTNKEHYIINLGDSFDRGHQNRAVLDFILEMMDRGRIINIAGNHDDFIEDAMGPADFVGFNCINNGFSRTVAEFAGVPHGKLFADLEYNNEADLQRHYYAIKANKRVRRYMNSLVDAVVLGDYVFTHAGLSPSNKDKSIWEIDNWTITPEFVKEWPTKAVKHEWFGKTFVFGHWNAGDLRKRFNEPSAINHDANQHKTFVSDCGQFIGLDAWCGVSGKINIMTIETNKDLEIVKRA